MRVPVLLLPCALAALVMAFLLLERIRKNRVFEQHSVSLLKEIGICALAAMTIIINLDVELAKKKMSLTELS